MITAQAEKSIVHGMQPAFRCGRKLSPFVGFLVCILWSGSTSAFTCFGPAGQLGWSGGVSNINVIVGPKLHEGKNTIVNLDGQVACQNDVRDPNWIDYLWVDPGKVSLNPAIFNDLAGGITVYGRDYALPTPEIKIFEQIGWLGAGVTRKAVPVSMYFNLKSAGSQLYIKKGDYLGEIGLIQGQNQNSNRVRYIWRLYALNQIEINTSSCSVSTGDPINISFGEVERMDLKVSGTGNNTIKRSFGISCTGSVPVNFNIRMNSSPATWNGDAVQTSNSNVGVVVLWGTNVMTNGSTQSLRVNGSATTTLSFTPVRPASILPEKISTGAFTASATLILSQQ